MIKELSYLAECAVVALPVYVVFVIAFEHNRQYVFNIWAALAVALMLYALDGLSRLPLRSTQGKEE